MLTQEILQFPNVSKAEVDIKHKDFLFVKEMKKVKLKNNSIERAISDYLRSKQSEIKLINCSPSAMPEALEVFDNRVLEDLELIKNEYAENIQNNDLNTEKAHEASKKIFHSSLQSPLIEIQNVSNTPIYYRNGRIHHNVNEKRFVWVFNEEDLK